MDESENTVSIRDEAGRFGPGNPGKPKGSKHKIAESFLSDLQALWKESGADILEKAMTEKPMEFAKMVAGLVPRDLVVRHALEDEMTDDELADTIAALAAVAERLRKGGTGAGALDAIAADTTRPQ
jgi:hypothetical protein